MTFTASTSCWNRFMFAGRTVSPGIRAFTADASLSSLPPAATSLMTAM